MRLRLDFSGRRSPPRFSSVIFFGLGIVLLAIEWRNYTTAATMEQAALELQAGVHAQVESQMVKLSPRQTEAVNGVIRQLNLPWENLLSAIEGQLSESIALLSVEPDAAQRRLRLQAEAKSADDMVNFVEALSRAPGFISATLVRHEINENDRNRPYHFSLEAEWSINL